MIRAIVGAGGKTSLIKKYSKQFKDEGKKVLVITSTHMFAENDTILSDDADEIIEKLKTDGYAMAGLPDSKEPAKIGPLSKATYETVCTYADEVLIEADGSKHMPLKYPRENEPVIYDNVDEITVVYGLHALGMKTGEAIHCFPLAKERLGFREDEVIELEHIEKLLEEGYLRVLKERYPDKMVKIYESNCSLKKVGCVIMASGLSKRFGCSKLLAEIEGKSFIKRILDTTEDLFEGRVVVTRSREVEKLCKARNIDVICHDMDGRNDTVRLGLDYLMEQASQEGYDLAGCIFCPCDQPMLRRESVKKMVKIFREDGEGIYRLSADDEAGTPVLFSREFFEDLLSLPERKGGSWVVKQNPQKVVLVEAMDSLELRDIDTREDMERLIRTLDNMKLKGE